VWILEGKGHKAGVHSRALKDFTCRQKEDKAIQSCQTCCCSLRPERSMLEARNVGKLVRKMSYGCAGSRVDKEAPTERKASLCTRTPAAQLQHTPHSVTNSCSMSGSLKQKREVLFHLPREVLSSKHAHMETACSRKERPFV
jgi:hypothetical protein